VKTTLVPKYGSPAKDGAGLALEREGQSGIPGPASPHLSLSSSFKCYNLKIYVVKNSKKNPQIPILISCHILQLKF
jgi:hypothetical protein